MSSHSRDGLAYAILVTRLEHYPPFILFHSTASSPLTPSLVHILSHIAATPPPALLSVRCPAWLPVRLPALRCTRYLCSATGNVIMWATAAGNCPCAHARALQGCACLGGAGGGLCPLPFRPVQRPPARPLLSCPHAPRNACGGRAAAPGPAAGDGGRSPERSSGLVSSAEISKTARERETWGLRPQPAPASGGECARRAAHPRPISPPPD